MGHKYVPVRENISMAKRPCNVRMGAASSSSSCNSALTTPGSSNASAIKPEKKRERESEGKNDRKHVVV